MASFLRKLAFSSAPLNRISCAGRTTSKVWSGPAAPVRSLMTAEFLNIGPHKAAVEKNERSHGLAKESFMKRLKEYCQDKSSPIFLEDLLTSIRFSKTDEELDTSVDAITAYAAQATGDKFNPGPVLFRQLYLLNNSEYALKVVNDPALKDLLMNTMAAHILCSEILFNNGYYDKVIEMNLPKRRQILSILFVLASALKCNTPETYALAKSTFNTLDRPPFAAIRLMGLLAYQQGHESEVFEILNSGALNSWFSKQLKMLCYIRHNRPIDAAVLFMNMTEVIGMEASPSDKKLWYKGVVDSLTEAMNDCPDAEVKAKFDACRSKVTERLYIDETMEDTVLNVTAILSRISTQRETRRNGSMGGRTQEQWEERLG